MRARRRKSVFLVLGLGLGACQDVDEDPACTFERLVDVHFEYDTDSMIHSETCELLGFGPSTSEDDDLLVLMSCGYFVEVQEVSPPEMELDVGDSIELRSQVDDPVAAALGCAENGWLSITDAQGQLQFAALSVAVHTPPLVLGDLGEVRFEEDVSDGCQVLRMSTDDEEATVIPASSTEIELDGVRLLVQLGPFNSTSSMGCGRERYSLAMFRLPTQ